MGVFEILLIIFCSLIVLGVIVSSIIAKKRGKTSCDCCDGNCSCCVYKDTENKKQQTK